jgi:hypothetical protein
MKETKKMGKHVTIFCAIVFAISFTVLNAQEIPKAQYPVVTTSAGQSTDVETLNIIAEEAGIGYDYCDVPTEEILGDGVGMGGRESADTGFHVEINSDLEAYPNGTPYKTIMFAIGASLKGMGASGLTIEDEEKRLKEVIDYCKANNIFIVAVHIGGVSKRGAPGGDNERMIDAVTPFADYIIVAKDSNKDGRFTTIAKDKNIPLTEVEYALGVVDIMKQMFQ